MHATGSFWKGWERSHLRQGRIQAGHDCEQKSHPTHDLKVISGKSSMSTGFRDFALSDPCMSWTLRPAAQGQDYEEVGIRGWQGLKQCPRELQCNRKQGGFWKDPKEHPPQPPALGKIQSSETFTDLGPFTLSNFSKFKQQQFGL